MALQPLESEQNATSSLTVTELGGQSSAIQWLYANLVLQSGLFEHALTFRDIFRDLLRPWVRRVYRVSSPGDAQTDRGQFQLGRDKSLERI